ncbi:hypothetical protein Xsto_04148 [Xenorhabdus stockiae]|uniref:Uncharacterized protein n=1 Tax=Xenorhabdus stockiae TaxID=351614 RepID=A0A2D0K3D0_9GAMM|nr:hypothetical protein [Xenorhabdus stockiae]PHM56543.1 hypothetical protein Xsto_04148 [Xenorhabdus stockiae]
MPKHIHADLISEYARLSHITDRPWEYFEFFYNGEWGQCNVEIRFSQDCEYRLKPRTIKIGEIEFSEPVRVKLKYDNKYYYPIITHGGKDGIDWSYWKNSKLDNGRLNSGLIHLDRESAELHAKALISLTSK